MRNIRLDFEYDGSGFYGFQRQPGHVTIQELIEKALSKVLNKKTKITAASGRTDTGVHALGQVVNFKTTSERSLKDIVRGLNANLPKKIVCKKAQNVADDFHARYGAKSKTYEYQIWNSRIRSPLQGTRSWQVFEKLNISKMRKGAALLKGKRDFKAFCASRSSVKSTVREIQRFSVAKEGSRVILRVTADGFLYHMVRNLTGTLVEVGRNKLSLKDLQKIVKSRDRRLAGATAPAEGLTLTKVTY